MTIAVMQTGGKQYVVQPGQTISIEKILGAAGDSVAFDRVLLTANDSGVQVGKPIVSGAIVTAQIVSQGLGPKIHVIKFKRKVRYKRDVGHRQPQTVIKIALAGALA